jgi:hypothetical protein
MRTVETRHSGRVRKPAPRARAILNQKSGPIFVSAAESGAGHRDQTI